MRVNFTLNTHTLKMRVNFEVNTYLVSEICQDNKKRVNIFYSV